jgi:hypothetical protein
LWPKNHGKRYGSKMIQNHVISWLSFKSWWKNTDHD